MHACTLVMITHSSQHTHVCKLVMNACSALTGHAVQASGRTWEVLAVGVAGCLLFAVRRNVAIFDGWKGELPPFGIALDGEWPTSFSCLLILLRANYLLFVFAHLIQVPLQSLSLNGSLLFLSPVPWWQCELPLWRCELLVARFNQNPVALALEFAKMWRWNFIFEQSVVSMSSDMQA